MPSKTSMTRPSLTITFLALLLSHCIIADIKFPSFQRYSTLEIPDGGFTTLGQLKDAIFPGELEELVFLNASIDEIIDLPIEFYQNHMTKRQKEDILDVIAEFEDDHVGSENEVKVLKAKQLLANAQYTAKSHSDSEDLPFLVELEELKLSNIHAPLSSEHKKRPFVNSNLKAKEFSLSDAKTVSLEQADGNGNPQALQSITNRTEPASESSTTSNTTGRFEGTAKKQTIGFFTEKLPAVGKENQGVEKDSSMSAKGKEPAPGRIAKAKGPVDLAQPFPEVFFYTFDYHDDDHSFERAASSQAKITKNKRLVSRLVLNEDEYFDGSIFPIDHNPAKLK